MKEKSPAVRSALAALPWAIAACLAVAAAGLSQLYLTAHSQRQLIEDQRTLAELELRSARQQLEAERLLARRQFSDHSAQLAEFDLARLKIATLAPPAGSSREPRAVAVWNTATQEGILHVSQLPAPAAAQDYQLWVTDPAYPIPADGGVFAVDPVTGDARISFRPTKPATNATQFSISLERKGGVPQAEGPIVLVGD